MFRKLDIDLAKFDAVVDKYDQSAFGGSFDQWGNVFKMRKELRSEESEPIDEHNPDEDTDKADGDQVAGSVEETVNVTRLRELTNSMDEASPVLTAILARFTSD